MSAWTKAFCVQHYLRMPRWIFPEPGFTKWEQFKTARLATEILRSNQVYCLPNTSRKSKSNHELEKLILMMFKAGQYQITFAPNYCTDLLSPYRYRRYFTKFAPVPNQSDVAKSVHFYGTFLFSIRSVIFLFFWRVIKILARKRSHILWKVLNT